jgi:hypothetical protein
MRLGQRVEIAEKRFDMFVEVLEDATFQFGDVLQVKGLEIYKSPPTFDVVI